MNKLNLSFLIVFLAIGTILFISCSPTDDDQSPNQLTISSVSPANNSVGNLTDKPIIITFSNEIDTLTLDSAFSIVPDIAFTISYDNKVATITPDSNLETGTTYNLSISTVLKDTLGDTLETNYNWSFETISALYFYFPMNEGDIWYYTYSGSSAKMVKQVSGDTVINNDSTVKILYDFSSTKEALSVDPNGFYTHMLDGNIEFRPPLAVPFSVVDGPYNFGSTVYIYSGGNIYTDTTFGTVTFTGYVTKAVSAGTFESVMVLFYEVGGDSPYSYYEYYAPNIGLLDNEEIELDSAYVGGVWYR